MEHKWDKTNAAIDSTISQRTGVGPNELVQGWQSMLTDLLDQIASYLKPSVVITFQSLPPEEKETFEAITASLKLPDSACGVFLSPSVRNQMMYGNRGVNTPPEAMEKRDQGVVLFSDCASREVIINALLANPPYSAAVDVYQNGMLLAGYVYQSADECLSSLNDIVLTHLGGS